MSSFMNAWQSDSRMRNFIDSPTDKIRLEGFLPIILDVMGQRVKGSCSEVEINKTNRTVVLSFHYNEIRFQAQL